MSSPVVSDDRTQPSADPALAHGAAPLLLASGPGSVSRFDMGLVICSGLAIGALFSLYVVPAIYTYLAADKSAVTAT